MDEYPDGGWLELRFFDLFWGLFVVRGFYFEVGVMDCRIVNLPEGAG